MPGVTADALQLDIRDDGARAKRLAGEADAQRLTHEAAAAVGANEIARAHYFAPNLRGDASGIRRKPGQLPHELRPVAEFGETFAHHCFGDELRDHQGRVIRLGRRGSAGVTDR